MITKLIYVVQLPKQLQKRIIEGNRKDLQEMGINKNDIIEALENVKCSKILDLEQKYINMVFLNN